jgi:hypothetical protein
VLSQNKPSIFSAVVAVTLIVVLALGIYSDCSFSKRCEAVGGIVAKSHVGSHCIDRRVLIDDQVMPPPRAQGP